MIAYWRLIDSLYCWKFRPSLWAVARSALMMPSQCCWPHAWPPSLPPMSFYSEANYASIAVTVEKGCWVIPPMGFCTASTVLFALCWYSHDLCVSKIHLPLSKSRFCSFRPFNQPILLLLPRESILLSDHFFQQTEWTNMLHTDLPLGDLPSPWGLLWEGSSMAAVTLWQ